VPIFLEVDFAILYLVFSGGAGFPTYITKKSFETARLVMSRRNVDFDEKGSSLRLRRIKKWRKE
jgi:hypothetical protein